MKEIIENPAKAHEHWGCFGNYMVNGRPWTEAGVCSDRCERRYQYWQERNKTTADIKVKSSS